MGAGDPEITQKGLVFRALVEGERTDNFVGDLGLDEVMFDVRGLSVDPDEDGHVAVTIAFGMKFLDFTDEARSGIRRLVVLMDEGAAIKAPSEAEVLCLAAAIVDDDAIGKGDVGGAAAEVVGDDEFLGFVTAFEVEDEIGASAAPFVDGLIVVPDHHVIAVRGRDEIKDLGLNEIYVLKFIDKNAGVAALDRGEKFTRAVQAFPGQDKHIVEGEKLEFFTDAFEDLEEVEVPRDLVERRSRAGVNEGGGREFFFVEGWIIKVAFASTYIG